MKRLVMMVLLAGLTMGATAGHASSSMVGIGTGQGLCEPAWTPLQLGAVPGAQVCGRRTDTCGLSVFLLGDNSFDHVNYGLQFAPVSFVGENCGVSLSVLGSMNVNRGVSMALFGMETRNYGVGVSLYNCYLGRYHSGGTQFGVVNDAGPQGAAGRQYGILNMAEAGWQFGLLNYNRKAAIQLLPFCNYSRPVPSPSPDGPIQIRLLERKKDGMVLEIITPSYHLTNWELPLGREREFHSVSPDRCVAVTFKEHSRTFQFALSGLHLRLQTQKMPDGSEGISGVMIDARKQYEIELTIRNGKVCDHSKLIAVHSDEERLPPPDAVDK